MINIKHDFFNIDDFNSFCFCVLLYMYPTIAGWLMILSILRCSNTYTFLNYCYVVHIREAVEAFSETVCRHYPPQEISLAGMTGDNHSLERVLFATRRSLDRASDLRSFVFAVYGR